MSDKKIQKLQIFLGGIGRQKRSDIEKVFGKFGKIDSMILMTRYGFIEFAKQEAVHAAIKEMNGKNIWGDGKITVESAFIKQNRDKTQSWREYK